MSYMRTICCDAPVELVNDFRLYGHWVLCIKCRDFKAFVPAEGINDMWGWTRTWSDFSATVQTFGAYMQQLLNAMNFAREDIIDEIIIGNGSEMVDGVWQPKGFLGAQGDPQSED